MVSRPSGTQEEERHIDAPLGRVQRRLASRLSILVKKHAKGSHPEDRNKGNLFSRRHCTEKGPEGMNHDKSYSTANKVGDQVKYLIKCFKEEFFDMNTRLFP